MKLCESKESGFSLVEVLISLLIFSLAALSVDSVLSTSSANLQTASALTTIQANGMHPGTQSVGKTISIPIQVTAPASSGAPSSTVTIDVPATAVEDVKTSAQNMAWWIP